MEEIMIKELKFNEINLVVGGRFLPGLLNLNPIRVVTKLLFHVTKVDCDPGEKRPGC